MDESSAHPHELLVDDSVLLLPVFGGSNDSGIGRQISFLLDRFRTPVQAGSVRRMRVCPEFACRRPFPEYEPRGIEAAI